MSSAIVMIHGRGPKPDRQALLDCWQSFLPAAAGVLPLEMVHWVDLFGYDPPLLTGADAVCAHLAAADLPDISVEAMRATLSDQALERLSREVSGRACGWPDLAQASSQVKDRALALLWDQFIRVARDQFALDAVNFFRDRPTMRTEARARLQAAIDQARAAGHEVLVLAHSFGTIVAYEAAREYQAREIHTLVTLGSPLAWCYDLWGPGAPPSRPAYLGSKEFPRHGLRHWWNVYDPADLIVTARVLAGAPQLGPTFRALGRPLIVDTPIANTYAQPGQGASPHDYRGYLTSQPAQRAIRLFMLETA